MSKFRRGLMSFVKEKPVSRWELLQENASKQTVVITDDKQTFGRVDSFTRTQGVTYRIVADVKIISIDGKARVVDNISSSITLLTCTPNDNGKTYHVDFEAHRSGTNSKASMLLQVRQQSPNFTNFELEVSNLKLYRDKLSLTSLLD